MLCYENQDASFVLELEEGRTLAIGVLDGHGRDHGRTAAQAAS